MLHKEKVRDISKMAILPLLATFYILACQYISYSFIIALVLLYVGQGMLLFRRKAALIPSGIFFTASHIFVIIAFSQDIIFRSIPLLYYISVGAVMLGILSAVLVYLRNYIPKNILVFVGIYLFSSILMSVFAYFRLACSSVLISLLGTILLFGSNVLLILARFDDSKTWLSRFVVEPVYITSVLLITISFMV